jgi:hypothetical protein
VTSMHDLWLPILLSTIAVFVMSSMIHMGAPWHKNDYRAMPREADAMDALRPLAIPPGDYMVPRPSSRQELGSAEFRERMKRGPVFVVTFFPTGGMSMARNLIGWFVYLLIVSHFAAYMAGQALPHGARYLRVFQLAGLTAFIAYAVALWQMSIWYGRAWRTTVKATIDGVIYAAITAGLLGWLWPK